MKDFNKMTINDVLDIEIDDNYTVSDFMNDKGNFYNFNNDTSIILLNEALKRNSLQAITRDNYKEINKNEEKEMNL